MVVVNRIQAARGKDFSHKNTLFHTAAHFRGCCFCGQVIFGGKNLIFSNEVNDLAAFIHAT
jgi:hypothetical protein